MSLVALAVAAALLAPERAVYIVIARAPDAFRALCARPAVERHGDPIAIVEKLFYSFKALQFAVFAAWCYVHGGGSPIPAHRNPFVLGLAAVLVVAGQIVNVTVFYRLGRTGVFFGDRLGYEVRRCRTFPFSVLSHPQYVGTLLTIWGLFLAARFPHGDWYILPVLETAYYAAGAWLEAPWPARSAMASPSRPNVSSWP
jgi:hypothetical protein